MTATLAAVLTGTAARRPGHTALIHGAERVTYAAMRDRARRHAGALRAAGVRPGDRVVLLLTDDLAFPVGYFGALIAGAVVVPLNVTSTVPEITHAVTDSGARFLTAAASLRDRARTATAGLGTVLLADTDTAAPVDEPVARDPDDVAVVFYTSGTTGAPKGVMLTHRNLLANVTRMPVVPYAFRDGDVLLGGLPLAHGFGQICGLLTAFQAGVPMVLLPRFDGAEALRLMSEHGCTVFMGVPTMYLKLLDAVAAGGPVPRLDRVFSGGSPLPQVTAAEIERVFGCPVYEGYGLTETSTSLAYHHPGIAHRPGTVGTAIGGTTLGVADPGARGVELLPAGAVGEIVARGDTVMAGYLGRPDLTAEVVVDGWFRTGDLGRLDADGYLTVVGRTKDLILRGGYNVYPREIEEVLAGHPAVAEVAVVGMPDERLGEEVWAVVVPARPEQAGPALGDELIEWVRPRVAAYKYPRRVRFATALPTGPSGKVLKRQIVAGLRAS